MTDICFLECEKSMNIEHEKSKRRIMRCIEGIEGVASVTVDMDERKITVIEETDHVYLGVKLRKLGFQVELLRVRHANQEKVGHSIGPGRVNISSNSVMVGVKSDAWNRGCYNYLGVGSNKGIVVAGQRPQLSRRIAIEKSVGSKKRIVGAVPGFGGMGSKTRIMEAVAGFGDFTSIDVDIKKGMVTVVGKSVPVSVALKVREMGYRAKLLSLGPATEEEDTDEDTTMISPATEEEDTDEDTTMISPATEEEDTDED